jgi:hypothetical protein
MCRLRAAAADGWNKETSIGHSLVRVDFAGGRLAIGVQEMGLELVRQRRAAGS